MSVRRLLRGLAPLVMFPPWAMGQLPKRVEKCLPYPTLLQEIHEMQASEPAPAQVRIRVIRVEFNPEDKAPENVRKEISARLRNQVFERFAGTSYLKELEQEIAGVEVMGALLKRGYFRGSAAVKLTELRSEGAAIDVAVAIRATPGTQYRTGRVEVEPFDAEKPLGISSEKLRELIPLGKGDLFSAEKILLGTENLTRAFSREGYVDMVGEPKITVAEDRKTMDLVYRIQQGKQYRVKSIEFLGVNSTTADELRGSLPKSGEIFDAVRVEELFRAKRAVLPSDATPDDMKITRDIRTKTVAVLFDFRTCPLDSN